MARGKPVHGGQGFAASALASLRAVPCSIACSASLATHSLPRWMPGAPLTPLEVVPARNVSGHC